MSAPKNMSCEVRTHVTENVHNWLKSLALSRSEPVSVFVRGLIIEAMEKAERKRYVRKVDPLIEEIHPLVEEMAGRMKAMSEKMGIEFPEKDSENTYQLEDESSAEKEG